MEPNDGIGRAFHALADVNRRQLLESLLHRDGQRPVELKERFTITRQGVLKHLHVLEEAGLITGRRPAGETAFYLNRDRFQQLQNGWLSQFTSH